MAEQEQHTSATRERVQNWLMSEGWKISEQPHPDAEWLIRAEDAAQRRILIGQNKARPDMIQLEARVNLADEHRKMFEKLPDETRRATLWDLRFRLLAMNVDFTGVAEPMPTVLLTQRIYLDGLTKDNFLQRFSIVRNAIVAVIWSITRQLEGVEPPAESATPTTH
ncbi:hypothetical protein D3OALGA1CA_5346 [Olavius algarvensis associated proteobacterium Delta 3]|nr:hypothetical protein D3OALGB2SA_4937 [Olavius algarvensis associated proteobacterium Delta 3]CAB5165341.1 hypothetical protein D3OALGA1CA_5346 [Olavius algarvensis associated proteobacterium Delta 3]